MRARRASAPALVALLVPVLLTGGCSVDVRRTPTTDSTVAQRVRETSRLHLDLREPLDREEAGIGTGLGSVAYDPRPGERLDVRLQLPEDRVLELQAISATISTARLGTDVALPPDDVLVIGLEPDAAAAEAQIAEDARRFGFPQDQVDATLQALRAGRTGTTGALSTRLGYLTLSLEVRLAAADGRVQLSYSAFWDAASPSP